MDCLFSAQIDRHRTLYLTEISRRTFEEQCSDDFESDSGFFIVLEDLNRNAFDVLAKASSATGGRALIEMMTRTNGMLIVHETELHIV
jgi:hypothetical protein